MKTERVVVAKYRSEADGWADWDEKQWTVDGPIMRRDVA